MRMLCRMARMTDFWHWRAHRAALLIAARTRAHGFLLSSRLESLNANPFSGGAVGVVGVEGAAWRPFSKSKP